MARKNYEHELEDLHVDIIRMGSLIERAIDEAVEAFLAGDIEACERVVRGEKAIDDSEKSIESKCLWLIAREQPVAGDLRRITAALKMITDMERIGDNASDIAEMTIRLKGKNFYADSPHIRRMGEAAVEMVHDAVSAYVGLDLDLAKSTRLRDDEVDDCFRLIKSDLAEIFKADEPDVDDAIDFLLVAKYIERIADHAVNICEWVEFYATGVRKNARIF
jgi:phosphate transport system protein